MNIKQLIITGLTLLFLQGCSFPQGYSVPPLAGYVYDQDGKPIEGADVEIISSIFEVVGYPDQISNEIMNRKPYSHVKTNTKGYYQTKTEDFLSSNLDGVSLSISKKGYGGAKNDNINKCFDSSSRKLIPDESNISIQINLAKDKIYNHSNFLDGFFFIHRKNANCYIAEDWQVSLSGKHGDKNPVIVPNLTLFKDNWKTW